MSKTGLLVAILLLGALALAQQTGGSGPDLGQIIKAVGENFLKMVNTGVSGIWYYVSAIVSIFMLFLMIVTIFVWRRSWTYVLIEAIVLAVLLGLPYLIGAALAPFNLPADKVAQWQCDFAGFLFYNQFCGGGGASTPGSTQTAVG